MLPSFTTIHIDDSSEFSISVTVVQSLGFAVAAPSSCRRLLVSVELCGIVVFVFSLRSPLVRDHYQNLLWARSAERQRRASHTYLSYDPSPVYSLSGLGRLLEIPHALEDHPVRFRRLFVEPNDAIVPTQPTIPTTVEMP